GGSEAASWTTWTPTPCPSRRRRASHRPSARADVATISETTRPAPSRAARRRNGASVTPDIGARTTGLASATGPMARERPTDPVDFAVIAAFAYELGEQEFCL